MFLLQDVIEKGALQMDWFFKFSIMRDVAEVCALFNYVYLLFERLQPIKRVEKASFKCEIKISRMQNKKKLRQQVSLKCKECEQLIF